ncbi:MAG: CBS domain-containing protein [Sphingomonas sp.]
MTITDVMTADPQTVSADDDLQTVAAKMAEGNFGSLPVLDGGALVGVVTDRDIVIRGVATGKLPGDRVRDVMTPSPVCVGVDCSVADAAKTMQDQQIRRLYVTDGDKLAGVVSLGDVALQAGDALSGKTLEQISKA